MSEIHTHSLSISLMHARAHARARTHTHTQHTHTLSLSLSPLSPLPPLSSSLPLTRARGHWRQASGAAGQQSGKAEGRTMAGQGTVNALRSALTSR